MNNNIKSFIINNDQKEKLNNQYSKFLCSNSNEYIESFYKTQDWSITIYNSGKAVLAGNNIQDIVNFLELDKQSVSQIGMDEVGVGDYFGGLVVCSVYIDKNDYSRISHLDIKDSKKLSDDKICHIAQELIKCVKFEVSQIYPKEYNILYDKFQNTHILKSILHNNALYNLINKNSIPTNNIKIILDQYVSRDNYYKYLKIAQIKNIVDINCFETKAESNYISVACASIIARYYFLEQIKTLSKKANVLLPLGAWNDKIHEAANYIIKSSGVSSLKEFVKLHFKNTNKLF